MLIFGFGRPIAYTGVEHVHLVCIGKSVLHSRVRFGRHRAAFIPEEALRRGLMLIWIMAV
jgi:hypothetical protein